MGCGSEIYDGAENCPCTASCVRRGKCCACVKSHVEKGNFPACFFSKNAEKTRDRSLEMLIKDRRGSEESS